MATQTKLGYGSAAQGITATCSGLADNGSRESTAISATNALEYLVQGVIATHSASVLTALIGVVNIYAYGTVDNGTAYSGNASGSDAAFTDDGIPQDLDRCPRIGTIACLTLNQSYESDVMSIAAAFGGVPPAYWGIIIENQTGQAIFSAAFKFQEVYATNS